MPLFSLRAFVACKNGETFRVVNSSLICGRLLFNTSSLFLCKYGHFNNRRYSQSSTAPRRHQTLFVPPSTTSFIVQIASRNHGTPVLSFIVL
jgi:hypothetical protein